MKGIEQAGHFPGFPALESAVRSVLPHRQVNVIGMAPSKP
jgi:hypothetical protein